MRSTLGNLLSKLTNQPSPFVEVEVVENANTMSLKATSLSLSGFLYLENSHFKAIDLGLERIKSVAEELDLLNPAPYVITVGGTNGKGTTCRFA